MKTLFCLVLCTLCCWGFAKPSPALLPEFLWSSSWETKKNSTSRFDFKLTAPGQNLSLRLQVLDRRLASSIEAFKESFDRESTAGEKTITQPGLGLYHLTTGSRLLYGVLDSHGLASRIRNVWIRGAPYAESHLPSFADLKTAPSSTAAAQVYTSLESPVFSLGPGELGVFSSLVVNDTAANRAPAFTAGADYVMNKAVVRLEGFYTKQTLPPRSASLWFSEKPPLPERDTRLFAGGAFVSFPIFGFAADLAHSETFAFGSGSYGNLGLRFGDKPWRFSLALDGAESRYVDAGGGIPGAGLRAAARLERQNKKAGLFRFSALIRGPGAEDFASTAKSFNRHSLELYYRLPTAKTNLALNRFSLSWDRDGRDKGKILNTVRAMTALKWGPIGTVSEGKISWLPDAHESYRISQSFSWTTASWTAAQKKSAGKAKKQSFTLGVSARIGYGKTAGKDGVWDTSVSASVRGKRSRFSLKAASPQFPKKWEYTLSWRIQL